MRVKIKNYTETPSWWNDQGHMDKYFGATIDVRPSSRAHGYGYEIEDDSIDDGRSVWYFRADDIEKMLDAWVDIDVNIFNKETK